MKTKESDNFFKIIVSEHYEEWYPKRKFPAILVIAPSSDIRQKIAVKVNNWDEVLNLQRARYEILEWKEVDECQK